MLSAAVAGAQILTITTQDGESRTVPYTSRTLKKRVVALGSGDRLEYARIQEIATDDFAAYEQAVKRTSRRGNQHVTVRYTGEGDVNVLRLEKLERQRAGAGAARGAGGLLMLLGVLSGNRDVYATGLVTHGVGTIVKDINVDTTLRVQTEAIQAQQRQLDEAGSLEEQYRIEYGNENVDGLLALIDGNHERALAFANVAETSDDANHRWSAAWLKAVIYADQGDREALEKEYERLVVLDPEVSDNEDAERWTERLLQDLAKMRTE